MQNIPTDLLRTLVAVVDLRSFTKAAQSLGVTQPAVSAQIKRLQFLLGYELLDKSAPGVSLTPRGRDRRGLCAADVVDQRRDRASDRRAAVGADAAGQHSRRFRRLPNSPDARRFPHALAGRPLQRQRHQLRQHAARPQAGRSRPRGRDLEGEAHDRGASPLDRQAVWVRSDATTLDPDGPVPLVSFGEDCACRYTAVHALHRVGRDCDFVFTARSVRSLEAAVAAGFGVMVMPRSRVAQNKPLDLGGCAAAGAAGALLRHLPARGRRIGRRSRSSPTISRWCCARSSQVTDGGNAAAPELPPAAAAGSS